MTAMKAPGADIAALLKDKKFSEVLALVQPIIEKNEKQPIAYIQGSQALRGLNDITTAQAVEKLAAQLFGSNVHVVSHVARMLNTDKMFSEAFDLLRGHIEGNTADAAQFHAASVALRSLKRNDDADKVEALGTERFPTNIMTLSRRAAGLAQDRRPQDVISLLSAQGDMVGANAALTKMLVDAKTAVAALAAAPAPKAAAPAAKPMEAAPAALSAAAASAAAAASSAQRAAATAPSAAAVTAPRAYPTPPPTSPPTPVPTVAAQTAAPAPAARPAPVSAAPSPAATRPVAGVSAPAAVKPAAPAAKRAPTPEPRAKGGMLRPLLSIVLILIAALAIAHLLGFLDISPLWRTFAGMSNAAQPLR